MAPPLNLVIDDSLRVKLAWQGVCCIATRGVLRGASRVMSVVLSMLHLAFVQLLLRLLHVFTVRVVGWRRAVASAIIVTMATCNLLLILLLNAHVAVAF